MRYILIDENIKPTTLKQLPMTVYMYNRAGMDGITQDLVEFCDTILDSDRMASSVETYRTRLRDFISDTMDQYIPTKTFTSDWSLPWYNRHLKRLRRKSKQQPKTIQRYITLVRIQTRKQNTTEKAKQEETKHTSTFLTDNTQNHKVVFGFFTACKQDWTGITTLQQNDS